MRHVLECGPGPPAPAAESRKLDKVYIRLSWLGPTSTGFKNCIFRTTREATATCTPVCIYTTCRMLSTCNEDVLLAVELSNVIYLFKCARGHGYVGRTAQRFEERIRKHVPVSLVAKATCHQQQEPAKKPVETKHTMVLRSQSRGAAERRRRLKTKPQMTKPRMTELWCSASLTAALPGTSRNRLSAWIKSARTC